VRTRAAIASILACSTILVGAWELGTAGVTTAKTHSSPSTAGSAAPAAPGATNGSFTGSVASTRFGNVQVRISVAGGQIADITALQLTDADGRSVSISNRAAPILRSEVIKAQSASVHSVSGATYTSDAYLTSLQAAIDQAGL